MGRIIGIMAGGLTVAALIGGAYVLGHAGAAPTPSAVATYSHEIEEGTASTTDGYAEQVMRDLNKHVAKLKGVEL